MPSQDKEKHERLGTLGSGSSKNSAGNQGLSSRFRPKNFAKPESISSDVVVKKETMDEGPQPSAAPRRNRSALTQRKKETGQDQVMFGGGIGAASKPSRRTSTAAKVSGESIPREKSGQKSGGRAGESTTAKVEVKEEDVYDSESTSSDEEEEGADDVYRPTTVICPSDMPRSIQEIDSTAHGEASDRIAHMFEDVEGDGLMLFQIPEKLPIFNPKDMSEEQTCSHVSDLHNTFLGKLLITKSGKVKMKIGDIVFDVSKGVECRERQELAIIDKTQSKLVTLGAIHNRITVSPDISTLLLDE